MTVLPRPQTAPLTAAARRIRSIGRAELLLLWRNRTAVFNAALVPIVLVAVIATAKISENAEPSANAFWITGLLGFVMLSAVFYNLVSTFVARREELTLKRLRVGEIADAEILLGTAGPAIAVALTQIVLFVLAGAVLLGLPAPVNVAVLAVGALAGIALFVLLAAACSAFTQTVEMAQITTLPILLICMVGSGVTIPHDALPEPVAQAMRFLPLTPAVELMRLGWLGTTGDRPPADFGGALGAAAAPVAILAAWIVLGLLAVRRWFRWQPRG